MHCSVKYIALLALFFCGGVTAHQWTPTYPQLRPSYIQGIHTTDMRLYNTRGDVDYYRIQVLDEDFKPLKFAIDSGQSNTINVRFRKFKTVSIYVPSEQSSRVVYICSKSLILRSNQTGSVLSSRICSKVNR
jgi:hypothetical protein